MSAYLKATANPSLERARGRDGEGEREGVREEEREKVIAKERDGGVKGEMDGEEERVANECSKEAGHTERRI